MRALIQQDTSAGKFAKDLLDIGDGRVPVEPVSGHIILPCGNMVASIEELKQKVYPNIRDNFRNLRWLYERAILAPRNDTVHDINAQILKQLPGVERCYKSIDTIIDETEVVNYPTEFLNSLQPSGMPSHYLTLKVGAPIILLRNLEPPRLCNGTRLVVKQLLRNVIQATIMSGFASGEDVFIPRIPLISSDNPIPFKRLQFPVKLCFAMSINKAQGQSLQVVGINLEVPCFSHGQLYVACSRVGKESGLFVYAPNGKTTNVVYPLALE